jgi:hypothetical protein
MLHTRPDAPDFRAHRQCQRRGRARILACLLAQGAVLVTLLASGLWGLHVLGTHTLASEESSSEAWLRPVYVGGCPVGGSGLAEGPPEEGCSEERPSHPSGSRRPGGGLGERAHGAEK